MTKRWTQGRDMRCRTNVNRTNVEGLLKRKARQDEEQMKGGRLHHKENKKIKENN